MFPFEQTPAIAQEQASDLIPNSYVQSCHECCFMYGPDGKGPNILGQLQQQMMTKKVSNIHGTYEYLDCAHCPVTIASVYKPAKTAEGKYIYWKSTGRQMTEEELVKLEMDGNDLNQYCDIQDQ